MIRQMVICTIDHTDGDLHNDQHTLIFEFYIWEHLKLKLKLNYPICTHTQTYYTMKHQG